MSWQTAAACRTRSARSPAAAPCRRQASQDSRAAPRAEARAVHQALSLPQLLLLLGPCFSCSYSTLSTCCCMQVFIGGQHVGGCDDTLAAKSSGKLKALLEAAGVSANL